jgi:hypothetical protein
MKNNEPPPKSQDAPTLWEKFVDAVALKSTRDAVPIFFRFMECFYKTKTIYQSLPRSRSVCDLPKSVKKPTATHECWKVLLAPNLLF